MAIATSLLVDVPEGVTFAGFRWQYSDVNLLKDVTLLWAMFRYGLKTELLSIPSAIDYTLGDPNLVLTGELTVDFIMAPPPELPWEISVTPTSSPSTSCVL